MSLLHSSIVSSQEIKGSEPRFERVKKGDLVKEEGMWVSQNSFLLWWQYTIELEEKTVALSSHVEKMKLDSEILRANLRESEAIKELYFSKLQEEKRLKEAAQKEAEDRYTTGQMFRIAGGSALIGCLVTLIILGAIK